MGSIVGPVGAAVPRCLRDEQVRARGDGRRAARRARAVGDPRRRSSSRARSRRRSGRSRSGRRPPSSRRRPCRAATASGSTGSGALAAAKRDRRRRTPSRPVEVAKAVEQRAHRRTAAEDALPRRAGRRSAASPASQKLPDRLRDRRLLDARSCCRLGAQSQPLGHRASDDPSTPVA